MKPAITAAILITLVLVNVAPPAAADGCIFIEEGGIASLAQTRQEVVMAFHRSPGPGGSEQAVTYVLQSGYRGRPEAFAWVVPVPATPEDVVAHDDDRLFRHLDEGTRPRFIISDPDKGGGIIGCGCAAAMSGADFGSTKASSVTVEAQGEAGIFAWAALRSTGGDALLTWLRDNRYAIPPAATAILDSYIRQGMRFLAVRVSRPAEVGAGGDFVVPPIQFTCRTGRMYYPMAISRISAAEKTEVLLYTVHTHRVAPENIPGLTIDPRRVLYDPESPSLTTYEDEFVAAIERKGGLALVTEYANSGASLLWREPTGDSAGKPLTVDPSGGGATGLFLTRMRTVIERHRMGRDFEFRVDARDQGVTSVYTVDVSRTAEAAAIAADPLFLFLLFGMGRAAWRRKGRRA